MAASVDPTALGGVGAAERLFDSAADTARTGLDNGHTSFGSAHLNGFRSAAAMNLVAPVWDGHFDSQRQVIDTISDSLVSTASMYVMYDQLSTDLFAAIPIPTGQR